MVYKAKFYENSEVNQFILGSFTKFNLNPCMTCWVITDLESRFRSVSWWCVIFWHKVLYFSQAACIFDWLSWTSATSYYSFHKNLDFTPVPDYPIAVSGNHGPISEIPPRILLVSFQFQETPRPLLLPPSACHHLLLELNTFKPVEPLTLYFGFKPKTIINTPTKLPQFIVGWNPVTKFYHSPFKKVTLITFKHWKWSRW